MKNERKKRSRRCGPLALLALCSLLAAGCSALGWTDSEEIAADLIDGFGTALVEDDGFAVKYTDLLRYERLYRDPYGVDSPRVVKVGFEIDAVKMFQNMRRSLYIGAVKRSPCRIAIPLKTDARGTTLSFSLGGLGVRNSRCDLSISVTGDGKSDEIFRIGGDGIPERGWKDYTIDLEGIALDDVSIEFRLSSASEKTTHVFLANPRIFTRKSKSSRPPNVVFISIDSLRADAVDAVVQRYGLTPSIDALARDGIVFGNHFVVSNWTRPSTICMLAGVQASRTGVNIFYPPVSDEEKEFFYRKSGTRSMTSILKESGYITRSIGNNAFIIDYTGIGVDLDFDELSEYQTPVRDTVDITDEAVAWIENNAKRRFFLFINYNAPHNAYVPPERYLAPLRTRFPSLHPWFRAYLGEVAYTDEYLGKVVDVLKRLGLYENTIIVVTSDHGEIFSPDKEMSPFTDVRALYSHGQTQYDEELRVPLVIKPQKGIPHRSVRIDSQVRSMDIAPTVLDFMGIGAPVSFQGKTIRPILDGTERDERPVYSEGRMMYSVRAHGYKYAERFYGFGVRPHHWGGEVVKEYAELYDLKNDPDERRNIVAERPDDTRRMRGVLAGERFRQPDNYISANETMTGGRLRVVDGFFYDLEYLSPGSGRSAIRKIGRKEIAFTLAPGDRIRFQTIPAGAACMVVPADAGALLAGRYLLPVFPRRGGAFRLDPASGAAGGEPIPEVAAMAGGVLYYWHDSLNRGLRGVSNEKYLSKDVNKLLERWGYIQGKEKRVE
ncbi:MAG TPA: sulfatase [Spirochaetota bacterium]|nr:sulfatase [Spirochaetota bacterium]